MGVIKAIAKWLSLVVLLIIASVAAIVATDFGFYKRLATFSRDTQITDFEWYEPTEVVAGTPGPPLARAPKGDSTIDEALAQDIINFAQDQNSVALLVWHKGAIQLEHYGDGYGPESRTNSASMHKSVMALAYGVLIEEGIIPSVDEPAATYITEWAGDDRAKITIRNLLHMASGLDRPAFSFAPWSDAFKFMLGTDVTSIALKYPSLDPPATHFSYSNLNSQVLGTIIERATGMRYAEALSKYLWSKLGTKPGYVWLDQPGGMARTSGALLVTAEDWLRMGLLHLNKGKVDGVQVVPENWIQEVTTPSPTNLNYGYQTWLGTMWEQERTYGKGVPASIRHSEPFAAEDIVYFDGSGGQRVYIVPSEDLVIVRTGPGGMDPKTGVFTWDDSVLPNLVIRGLRANTPATEQEPVQNMDATPDDAGEPEATQDEGN